MGPFGRRPIGLLGAGLLLVSGACLAITFVTSSAPLGVWACAPLGGCVQNVGGNWFGSPFWSASLLWGLAGLLGLLSLGAWEGDRRSPIAQELFFASGFALLCALSALGLPSGGSIGVAGWSVPVGSVASVEWLAGAGTTGVVGELLWLLESRGRGRAPREERGGAEVASERTSAKRPPSGEKGDAS